MLLSDLLAQARERLVAADVPSPRADAELLAAHVLATSRGEVVRRALLGHDVSDEQTQRYDGLLAERVQRVPLQHLTGTASFRTVTLQVGPGVFVPRPETELVVDLAQQRLPYAGRVVDLCTGSGAVAAALRTERPDADVWAVELDPLAHAWAERNLAGCHLHRGDATDPATLAELDGTVDVVASNPPYIPVDMVPTEPEVRDHDPALALYGGSSDGLAVPLAVTRRAASLLRPGGWLVMEHADVQGDAVVSALQRAGWVEVHDVRDLNDRPRVVVARRAL